VTRFVYFVGGGVADLTIKAVPRFDTDYAFYRAASIARASLEPIRWLKVTEVPIEVEEDRYRVVGRALRHPNGGEYVVAAFIHEQGPL
jgi:hypothetical protein